MSDDLDDLLRRALSTLDRQVPDGYFDALPERTLARLDGPPEIDGLGGLGGLDGLDDLARERAARGARSQPPPPDERAVLDHPAEAAPASAEGTRVAPRAALDATPVATPRAAPGGARDGAPGDARDAAAAAPVRDRPRRAIVAVGAGLAAAVLVLLFLAPPMRTAMSPPPEHAEAARVRSPQAEPAIAEPDLAPPTTSPVPAAPYPSASRESSPPRMPSPPRATQRPLPAPRAPSARVFDSAASGPLPAPPPAALAEVDDAQPPPATSSTQAGEGRRSPPSITNFTAAPEPSAADVEHAMRLLSSRLEACLRGATGKATVDATFLPSGGVSAVKLLPPFAATPREACVRGVVESVHFPSWTGAPRTYRFAITAPEVLSIPQAHPSEGPPSHP